jgi:hypothetical protein
MTIHGVNVVVVLHEGMDDWDAVNKATEPWQDICLGAGTGFGRRDMQFEASGWADAEELAVAIRQALVAAGLGPQVETCEPYEHEEDLEEDELENWLEREEESE